MVRQVIPLHVFHEPRPGQVAHTAASRLLTQGEGRAYNAYVVEDCLPMAAKHVEAVEKWGHGAQEPTQSALNLAYNTNLPFFPFFNSDPARRDRFSKVMQASAKQDIFDSRHILETFDWPSLGEATVVDVGGNIGHASVVIAAANPKIKCVVEDLLPTIALAQDPETTIVPSELKDQVTFMAHDFYQEQPVKGAAAYFIRLIMHDYLDKYCVKILKAIVPAMAPSSKMLIMDQVLPPVGVAPAPVERQLRTMDSAMMLLFNAKERELGEWQELIKMVDSRLTIKNVKTRPGGGMSILEIVLQ
jgi:6-hydroxytryprostatin B O-methyltransferase